MASARPFTTSGMLRHLHWLAVACGLASSLLVGGVRAEVDPLRGARVTAGELVAADNGFTAGPVGATVSFEHGSQLEVGPRARLRFLRHQKLHLGSGPDPMFPTRVLAVESGSVTGRMPAPTKRFALLLIGPRKLQSILSHSGEMTMIASEDRGTVAAHQGTVLVTLGEKWRRLPAGMTQLISKARPDGLRRSILGAPSGLTSSRSLLVEGEAAESSTTVTWPTLPGAVAYDVQLRGDGEAVVREVRTTEPRALFRALPGGNYRLSVRGIDDSGISGAASPALALNVVGLHLPETASRGPDGSIRLQPGQRVALVGAEGLEVSYLGFDDFLPVPQTLGLVARRPIAVTLRHPKSRETLGLKLEPMTVSAGIFFAPQPHDWPARGLDITVKLVDAKGHPIPDNFEVSFRVTVNVESVSPVWRREGSTLRTSLERPRSEGPWMVRVDVLDQSGASIGMDFTEVGYSRAAAHTSRR